MFDRKTLAAAAGAILVLALVAVPVTVSAQEVQDEGFAYRAWHSASQAGDSAKAMAAAKNYLKSYPTGEYADFLKKWLAGAEMAALDAAIKQKRTSDMLTVGKEILASDPDNLNVLYALAFNLRINELMANPPKYDHAKEAKEIATKSISLIEGGATLAGVQNFNKDATLAWLYQSLAAIEAKQGTEAEAVRLYKKSSSLAPDDVAIKGRNLLTLLSMKQAGYAEAARAFNALPEEDRAAAEPNDAVKEAREKLNAEADQLIDTATDFIAFGKAKSLPEATVAKVNDVLETVYKVRFPEDTELAGLKKMLADKGVPSA